MSQSIFLRISHEHMVNVEATFSDLFLGGGGFGGKLSYISDGFVLFNSRNKTELSNIVSVVCR